MSRNWGRKQNATANREAEARVETSTAEFAELRVSRTARQGVRGPHPSVADWECKSLEDRQSLLEPLDIVFQEP